MKFVAIDFETADYGPDSACSVALVRVEGNEIVAKTQTLIRPPRSRFQFTYIHGIKWEHVKNAPTFGEIWPTMEEFLQGADHFVAHNASFDRGVLQACCTASGLSMPALPFRCTVKLARQTWQLPSNKLNLVCEHLQIPLKHHDALSDAEACARIVIAAQQHHRLFSPKKILKW
ncbi:MAG: 3'-5' exonuclease [Acidobacteria bacterium]|nr:3'-5' exonuclease [Acidobacteriota bacterium]